MLEDIIWSFANDGRVSHASLSLPEITLCSSPLLQRLQWLEDEGLANSDESSWDTATTEAYGDAFGSVSSGHFGTPFTKQRHVICRTGRGFFGLAFELRASR
jgi:hypothetical protein